jgi:hypothetical protein
MFYHEVREYLSLPGKSEYKFPDLATQNSKKGLNFPNLIMEQKLLLV